MILSSSSFSSSAFRFAEVDDGVLKAAGGGGESVLPGTGDDLGDEFFEGFTRRGNVFSCEFGGGRKASGDRESIDSFNFHN